MTNMSVLVVDDDDIDREAVLRLLRRAPFGINAVEASSGAQALCYVKTHPFDCIVLDNHLGDTLGSQILPTLRHEGVQDCPIIMVTGEGDESLAVQVLQDGASDYLPKRSLSANGLLSAIRRSVDQQRLREALAAAQHQLEVHVQEQARTLRRQERDLQSVLHHFPAFIGYWDTTLHIRFGNQICETWFKVTQHQLPGMHMRDLVGQARFAMFLPHCEAALRGQEQFFEQVDEDPSSGPPRRRYLQAHFIPDTEANGLVSGFFSFITDVSTVQEARARAQALASLNEAVIQSSPVGIAVYRTDGQCIMANAALANALHQTQDALLTENFRHLLWWHDVGLQAQAQATLFDGHSRRCEIQAVNDPSHQPVLDCNLVAIAHDDERRLLFIAQDVTIQRTVQTELAAARDAARNANAAKSAFLANMSHEIRTPMNAIIGLSRIALEEDLPPRASGFLDKIHGASLALMGILDDILDYSKIEAGQLHFEQVTFSIDELVQRVADLFSARMVQKGLTWAVDMATDVPGHFIGDPLRLSQVLNNLVGNAVKFTDHGSVTLRIATAAQDTDPDASCRLQFSVSDTGMGIAPHVLPHLFDAFTQADSSITRCYGGSGLGLAICKRLVEHMDGHLEASSVPNHGSEFRFTARLGRADQAATPSRTTSVDSRTLLVGTTNSTVANQLKGWRVLVVEDNQVNQIVAAETLHFLGADVVIANDGLEAIERVSEQPADYFHAILMDLHMPHMDGFEAARRLRQLPQAKHSAIIAMSAAVLAADKAESLAAGMVDHVAKPVIAEQLVTILLKWTTHPPPTR